MKIEGWQLTFRLGPEHSRETVRVIAEYEAFDDEGYAADVSRGVIAKEKDGIEYKDVHLLDTVDVIQYDVYAHCTQISDGMWEIVID